MSKDGAIAVQIPRFCKHLVPIVESIGNPRLTTRWQTAVTLWATKECFCMKCYGGCWRNYSLGDNAEGTYKVGTSQKPYSLLHTCLCVYGTPTTCTIVLRFRMNFVVQIVNSKMRFTWQFDLNTAACRSINQWMLYYTMWVHIVLRIHSFQTHPS